LEASVWQRLPIWFRAIILGLTVAGVPTIVWAVLAATNLKLTPGLPWSVPLMAGILWLYWRYLDGGGPQRHLAEFCREHLRAVALTPQAWRLALVAGGSALAAVWAAFAALRGLLHIAPPASDVTQFPIITIIAAIVMGSAVAGVVEEAGFRGYMQLPLERAYGSWTALATTSIIFTLVHLTHGAAVLPFLPFYLAAAAVYGLMAWLTGSILPGMTLHFAGDVMLLGFRYMAARVGGVPAATGTISIGPAIVFAALGAFSVVVFRQPASEKRGKRLDALPDLLRSKAA